MVIVVRVQGWETAIELVAVASCDLNKMDFYVSSLPTYTCICILKKCLRQIKIYCWPVLHDNNSINVNINTIE